MAKEIYISTTPHETRLAIVEDEQLAEIYYERENEYSLAGSIYNGKVTRVLPGMQSSFVDIGLERDAFLYVTDFMEEQGDAADFDAGSARKPQAPREPARDETRQEGRSEPRNESRNEPRGERRGRDRGARDRNRQAAEPTPDTPSFDEPVAPHPVEETVADEISQETSAEGQGSRRWRGRRGRRRGRAVREGEPQAAPEQAMLPAEEPSSEEDAETFVLEGSSGEETPAPVIEIDLGDEDTTSAPSSDYARARDSRREEIRRGRHRMRGQGNSAEPSSTPAQTGPVDSPYGAEEVATAGTAFVLPGESIRKYRDPSTVEREEAGKPAPAPAAEAVAPSTASFEVVGWDGGSVLPGETLSRHRSRQERTPATDAQPVSTQPVSAAAQPVEAASLEPLFASPAKEAIAPTPIPAVEPIAEASVPEETGGLTQHPAPADEEAAVQPMTVDAVVVAAEAEVAVSSAGEYEPAEGESASLGDAGRRDLRRLEQRPETVAAESGDEDELAASHDATTYDLQGAEADASIAEAEHSAEAQPVEQVSADVQTSSPEHGFTTLQDSGEMLSKISGEAAATFQHVPPAQDEEHAASPVLQEGAVHSVTLENGEFTPASHPLEEEMPDASTEAVSQVHAYGDGDLHEEEVDGDEFEYDLALASADEDEFDYEEETLDETADVGAMLHEMAVDESVVATDGTEEDEYPAEAAAGGFTVEDFGGEPDEDSAETTPNESSPQDDRRGRRDSRRPGRERRPGGGFRGGAGADRGRGRGRPSVQTTDLPAINELLKPGQEILVQIAKEPIAKKGARITSHIALPGRFLVFMPTVNHTGVSRKISSDEERRRLKSILLSEKGEAQGGFIVRTAAEGASEEELRNDLRFLIQLWQDIKMRSESSKSPALIYHDLSLIERILRDQVTDNFSAIWVDTEGEYERVLRFLQRFQPSLVRRVKLYTKETPLFEHFGVTQEIDKALKSKVWLKSGGSIVIDQTEALVAIDINTGKYVGKTARLEDTILKTNLDAIPEIVRQIRLRDLGGIIVIDFIDMDERKNRAKVMQVLEDELKSDRAPSKVLPFNDFGLVIMTRKRVKQSLERTLCIPDPITEGTGMIKSPITVANEIYIEMRKMHRHIEKGDVMLRVHPEVVKQLKAAGGKRLQELEEMTHKTILVKSDPALNPEQFDIH